MTKTAEEIAEEVIKKLEEMPVSEYSLDEVKSYIANVVREAQAESRQAPAFKPEGEPDEYRDVWESVWDSEGGGDWAYGIQFYGPRHVSNLVDLTPYQARRILEMLSSEDTQR